MPRARKPIEFLVVYYWAGQPQDCALYKTLAGAKRRIKEVCCAANQKAVVVRLEDLEMIAEMTKEQIGV